MQRIYVPADGRCLCLFEAGGPDLVRSVNDTAVATGLQRSGRIITSAAFLVMLAFQGFAAGQTLGSKEFGLALTIAVAVDASLVRCVLVPATMTLLGRANWWAPAPLRRLYHRLGLHEAPGPRPVLAARLSPSQRSLTCPTDQREAPAR